MAGDIPKMTRLMKLVAMLRKNSYPNHRKLERALKLLDTTCMYSISQKTIQRDVQYLRDIYGAPIAFDNGKRGYYLTDQNWKFEVPQLDEDEMRAVTLGARLAETIMPEPVASEIQSAAETLLCDNPSGMDANAALIALVGSAIPALVSMSWSQGSQPTPATAFMQASSTLSTNNRSPCTIITSRQ